MAQTPGDSIPTTQSAGAQGLDGWFRDPAQSNPSSTASPAPTGGLNAWFEEPKPAAQQRGAAPAFSPISSEQLDQVAATEGLTPTQRQVMGALLEQETNSGRNAKTSINGARGAGQIMPDTFRQYARAGERIDDPASNLAVAARIIKDLGGKSGDDPARIATGYFSGAGNVNTGTGNPWRNDAADGNGKRVSAYVGDVLGRLTGMSTANAAEVPAQAQPFADAPKWSAVTAKPEYAALSDDDKEAAREAYYQRFIAPSVPQDQQEAYRAAFDKKTAAPAKPGIVERASTALAGARDTIREMAGTTEEQQRIDKLKRMGLDAGVMTKYAKETDTPNGQLPKPLQAIADLPATDEFKQKVRDQWAGATPAARKELEQAPGHRGYIAKQLNAIYGDKPVPTSAQVYASGSRAEPSSFDFDAHKAYNDPKSILSNPVVRGAVKGIEGFRTGSLGMAQFAADALGADDFAARMKSQAKASGNKTAAMGESSNFVQRNFEGAVSSIAQQLPALVGGAATGSQALVLGSMFAQTFGQEYGQAREQGKDMGDAAARAAIFGSFEVAGEKLGLGKQFELIRQAARGQPTDVLAGWLANTVKKELPGELFTTTGQFATDKAESIGLNPDASFADYLNQMADTTVQTLMQSGIMGGGAQAAGAVINRVAGERPAAAAPTPAPRAAVPPAVDERVEPTLGEAPLAAPAAAEPAPTQTGASGIADTKLPEWLTKQQAADPEVAEFIKRSRQADAEEKQSNPDDWTAAERTAYDSGDWRKFSELRGYNESEIENFQKFIKLADSLSRKYGNDFAQTLDFMTQQPVDEDRTSPVGIADQDVLDYADSRYRQLRAARDGEVAPMDGGDGNVVEGVQAGAGLSEADAAELAFLQQNRGDARALARQYGFDTAQPDSATVAAAANEAATSPENDLPEPTQAQKEAGNYRKGKVQLHGLDIAIENPQGSTRSGVADDGRAWSSTLTDGHYGYVRGTKGADGDAVDVFVGPTPQSTKVFVIDQIDPKTGRFDETKTMLGYNSEAEANAAYHANHEAGWNGMGSITETTTDAFKAWLNDGDTTKPFGAGQFTPAAAEVPEAAALVQQHRTALADYKAAALTGDEQAAQAAGEALTRARADMETAQRNVAARAQEALEQAAAAPTPKPKTEKQARVQRAAKEKSNAPANPAVDDGKRSDRTAVADGRAVGRRPGADGQNDGRGSGAATAAGRQGAADLPADGGTADRKPALKDKQAAAKESSAATPAQTALIEQAVKSKIITPGSLRAERFRAGIMDATSGTAPQQDERSYKEGHAWATAKQAKAAPAAEPAKPKTEKAAKDASAEPSVQETNDELYQQAVDIVQKNNHPSISLVQRALKIGYNRAGRLLEMMEANGIVTPMKSDGLREIVKKSAPAKPKKSLADQRPAKDDLPDLNNIERAQTDTPAFKRWFGDSKVVDENGKPLVVYHGTNKDITKFKGDLIWVAADSGLADQFVAGGRRKMGDKAGRGSSIYPLYASIQNPVDLRGLSLSSDVTVPQILERAGITASDAILEKMARENLDSGHTGVGSTIEDPVAYLVEGYKKGYRLSNLLDNPGLKSALEAGGIDGVVLNESYTTGTRKAPVKNISDTYAAFRPSQLKSAIGNRGTFSAADASILNNIEHPMSRKELQTAAREAGLRPSESNDVLRNKLRILAADPRIWAEDDLKAIAPDLAMHQDTRAGSADRVEGIMREGLPSGMVDNLGAVLNGGLSWAKKLHGGDVYLFPARNLQYASPTSGWLAQGNMPLIHFKATPGQSFIEAINQTGTRRSTSGPLSDIDLTQDGPLARQAEPVRVNTLAKLKALEKKREAGKLTDAEYQMAVQLLIGQLEHRADAQQEKKARPRERGELWLRERLLRAKRLGELSADQVDFALWALDQNPNIANDLGISLRESKGDGVAGSYIPGSRIISLVKGNGNTETVVHEIMHHTERMMPPAVQQGIVKEWARAMGKAWKSGTPAVRAALGDMMLSSAGDKKANERMMEAFRKGVLNYDDHYHLVNASEFWAVNASEILAKRADAAGRWVAQARQWLREMIEKIKGLLNLSSSAPVLAGLQRVLDGQGKRLSNSMLVELSNGQANDVLDGLNDIDTDVPGVPELLQPLAKLIKGKSFDAAKRAIVAQVGSVGSREKFDDDVADSVFTRLQRTAQVGRYTDEADLAYRKAKRLEGDGDITIYRAAPKGGGLRPGDFAAGSKNEAGFYKHGTNVVQKFTVKRGDVIAVEGSSGGGQEYVYLPKDYKPTEPAVYFDSIREFYDTVNTEHGPLNSLDLRTAAQKAQADLVDEFGKPTFSSIDWWDKSVGTQYHKAAKNPLFKKVYDLAIKRENAVSLTAIRAAELAPGFLPRVDDFMGALKTLAQGRRTGTQTDLAGKALLEGTLAGTSVIDGKVWTNAELRAKGLNDQGIALYRQAREAIDASLDEVAAAEGYSTVHSFVPKSIREQVIDDPRGAQTVLSAALAKRIQLDELHLAAQQRNGASPAAVDAAKAKLLQSFDVRDTLAEIFDRADQLKRAGYTPLMRFGNYYVQVEEVDPQTGKTVIDPQTGKPNTLYFSRFETEGEASDAYFREQVANRGKDNIKVTSGPVNDEAFKMFAGISPETLELFADVVGAKEATEKFYQEALSERSALKRRITRNAIEGYSENMPRVLANFITSNGKFAAQRYYNRDINNAIRYIPRLQGDVQKEAMRLKEYIDNPGNAGSIASALSFTWFLGGNVASALINATQPVMMTLPYLSQFGAARAAAELTKAAPYAMGRKQIMDADLKAALKRGSQEGKVDAQEIFHLYSVGIQGVASILSGKLSKLPVVGGKVKGAAESARARLNALGTLWGMPFAMVEGFNRRLTFIAAWNVAKATGQPDPYQFAVDAVDQTQGVYNKVNRPNWARGPVGRVIFTFAQFKIMNVEMIKRLATMGGPEGKKAAAMYLATLILAAGLAGVPYADDVDDIIDTVGQWLGYNTNMKRTKREWAYKTLGRGFGDLALYGVSSHLPVDVGGRMGLGNMFPATGILKPSGEGNRAQDIMELGGPAISGLGRQVFDAYDAASMGNYGKAAMTMMPTAVKNMATGAEMAATGKAKDMKGRVKTDVTPGEAFAKALGLNPTVVAEKNRANMPINQDLALQRLVETSIVDQWAQGVATKNPQDVQQAMQRMKNWNEKNPETPVSISAQQLRAKVKTLLTPTDTRLLKGAPKEMRGRVVEGLKKE